MMIYALWNAQAGALTDEYPTEQAALEAVCRAVQAHGEHALAGYALLRDDGEHDPVLIAADADLVARATR